jgi:predicted Zn-dependent peptidase
MAAGDTSPRGPMFLRDTRSVGCATGLAVALAALVGCATRASNEASGARSGSSVAAPARAMDARAIVAASKLPAPLAEPLPDDPMRVTIARLDNGLTIYVSPDKSRPFITTRIVVRAGARHDPADSTGLAHYLEHMLFKGSGKFGTIDEAAERPHLERIARLYAERFVEKDEARRALLLAEIDRENVAAAAFAIPRELRRMYAAIGAQESGADTTTKRTEFQVDIPSNRLAQWARIESERFMNPRFRLFLGELEAVYEEKNKYLDDPDRRVAEKVMALAFPRHPYGTQPTIGAAEHLQNPAFDHMVEFFARWYVPNNIAIVLAGDVDAATAVPLLREAFGSWRPKPLPPPPPGEIAPLAGRVRGEILAEAEELVWLAWLTVPVTHEDVLPLEMLAAVAGDDRIGLFTTRLVLPGKALSVDADTDFFPEAGLLHVGARPKRGQSLAEVERLTLEVLAEIKAGRFNAEDLDAIILNSEIRRKIELESNAARADVLVETFVGGQPWPQVAGRLSRLRQVTKADVVRVANRYLGPHFVAIEREQGKFTPPAIAKPKITPLPATPTRKSAFFQALERMPVQPLEPEWAVEGKHYRRGRLPAGPLITAHNERNDLFHLVYEFPLGSDRQPLVCHALDLQSDAGAGALTSEGLQRRLNALGVHLGTDCGRDKIEVVVSGSDSKMPESLVLLEDWFRRPRFDRDDVSKLLERRLTARKNALASPSVAATALASFAVDGDRSGFLRGLSNAQLQRAGAAELERLIKELPDHAHTTRYFGPRSLEDVAPKIAFGTRHRRVPPPPPRRHHRARKDTLYFLPQELAQTQVWVAVPFGPLAERDRALAVVLGSYLNQGTGPISTDLRERRGLAYTAGAALDVGERPGDDSLLTGYVATQPDKTDEALRRLLEILRKEPIDPELFAEAKAEQEEGYRATRPHARSMPGLVASWDRRGLAGDPRPVRRREIAQLSLADVQRFMARLVAAPVNIAIAGDRARLDLAALRKIAPVEEIALERLFNYGPFPAEKPAPPPTAQSR